MDPEDHERSAVDLDTIIIGAVERGLTVRDIKAMPLGQTIDYVIEYHNRQVRAEQKQENEKDGPEKRRAATQADIDAYFG